MVKKAVKKTVGGVGGLSRKERLACTAILPV